MCTITTVPTTTAVIVGNVVPHVQTTATVGTSITVAMANAWQQPLQLVQKTRIAKVVSHATTPGVVPIVPVLATANPDTTVTLPSDNATS